MDSAGLAQKLSAYDANPVTSASALNEALGQFGVPEIRNNVAGLRTTVANTTNALNNVDPSVTGRTSGSLVTEAQRQRLVNMERTPIASELQNESGNLNTQNQSLQDALSQATTQASNKVNDYNSGRKALQDEYTTAYQREQDAKAAADSAAKFAYQQQQDAITNRLNQQKVNSSGGGSGGGSSAATPTSTQRKGGGFNFTDASGNPISARLYAQLTGTSFNTVLKKMAASGDTGAAAVLKSGAKAASYKALTWD